MLAAILACQAPLLCAVCLMRCRPLECALFVPNRQGPGSGGPWIVKTADDEKTRSRAGSSRRRAGRRWRVFGGIQSRTGTVHRACQWLHGLTLFTSISRCRCFAGLRMGQGLNSLARRGCTLARLRATLHCSSSTITLSFTANHGRSSGHCAVAGVDILPTTTFCHLALTLQPQKRLYAALRLTADDAHRAWHTKD